MAMQILFSTFKELAGHAEVSKHRYMDWIALWTVNILHIQCSSDLWICKNKIKKYHLPPTISSPCRLFQASVQRFWDIVLRYWNFCCHPNTMQVKLILLVSLKISKMSSVNKPENSLSIVFICIQIVCGVEKFSAKTNLCQGLCVCIIQGNQDRDSLKTYCCWIFHYFELNSFTSPYWNGNRNIKDVYLKTSEQ